MNQKLNITIGNKVITAVLNESKASRDFISLLPLKLTLEDYNGTEKISNLPKKLSRDGAPAGFNPSIGDITYYAPWGNLAIFYKDFSYSPGLVSLGKIEGGIEVIRVPGSLNAKIEIER